jgi:hypothetical protein
MNLQQLVEKFILKDSKSLINISLNTQEAKECPFEKAVELKVEAKVSAKNTTKKPSPPKVRPKSRNTDYQISGKKVLAVDTKLMQTNVNPTDVRSVAQSMIPHPFQGSSKVNPFSIATIQTSRSQSTGKFSGHIESMSKEARQTEKLSKIEATVTNLLKKNSSNERIRRSKSGVCHESNAEKSKAKEKKYFTGNHPKEDHRPRSSTASKDQRRGFSTGREQPKAKKTVQTPRTSREDQSKQALSKERPTLIPSKSKAKIPNTKGLGIDIESINKCMKPQKGAMPTSKTLKTTKATATTTKQTEINIKNGKKTPENSHRFKSDFLNSLKNKQFVNQNINPTAFQQACVRQNAQSVTPVQTVPITKQENRANKLPMTQSCTATTLLSSSKSMGKLERPAMNSKEKQKGGIIHIRKTSNLEGMAYKFLHNIQEP